MINLADASPFQFESKSKNSILAAFVSDVHCLGTHWVYDRKVISELSSENLWDVQDAISHYHSGKKAGELTHLGHQLLNSLRNINRVKGFEAEQWLDDWYDGINKRDPTDYVLASTKGVLENIEKGLNKYDGSIAHQTDDPQLSASVLWIPLLAIYNDEETLVSNARKQTRLLHANPLASDATELIARSTYKVLNENKKPLDAIIESVELVPSLKQLVQDGIESGNQLSNEEAASKGVACPLKFGIPIVVRILVRHQDDGLGTALVANKEFGGESSARAMWLSLLMGSKSNTPSSWLNSMKRREEVLQLLETL